MSSKRPDDPSEEKFDSKMMLLGLLLLLGAGGLLWLSLTPDTKTAPNATTLYSKKYEEKVNRYLMLTNEKMELQKQRMMVENHALAPDYEDTRGGQPYQNSSSGVDLSGDGHAEDVARELGREGHEASTPQTPHEMIQTEIFNARQAQEYSQAYKKEYARQFIENAAKNGWDVRLSDDFRVLSVKPMRKPSNQMQLFNTGGGSSQ
jgi:hypothetical protein